MKIFQLIDLIIKLFKLNKRSKVVLLFLVPTFLLGQNQAFWLGKRPSGGTPTNLLLDDYPGAAAAYSVRKLDKDYTGFAMEIRRQSDNATQNIGFVGEDLDEASVNSFCSGTTCYVQTWYDQSGNSRNVTSLNQPTIYTGGAIIVTNNKPSIFFGSGNQLINTSSSTLLYSDFVVAQPVTLESDFITMISFVDNATSATGVRPTLKIYDSKGGIFNANAANNTVSLLEQYLQVNIQTSSQHNLYKNTSLLSTASGTAANRTVINFGLNSTNDLGTFRIQEYILYDTDKNSIRNLIEANINSYFSIY